MTALPKMPAPGSLPQSDGLNAYGSPRRRQINLASGANADQIIEIHTHNYIDGKKVGHHVHRHVLHELARDARRPDAGSGFDPMADVQRPGTPLAGVNI